MIYKIISEWLNGRIALLNDTLGSNDKLRECSTNFDMDMLPAGLKDNSYLIKLSTAEINENEAAGFTVSVRMEFHFRLYKKIISAYNKLIDEKLFALCSILTGNETAGLEYSAYRLTIANIHNIKITGLDRTAKGGEFIFPAVELNLQIFVE